MSLSLRRPLSLFPLFLFLTLSLRSRAREEPGYSPTHARDDDDDDAGNAGCCNMLRTVVTCPRSVIVTSGIKMRDKIHARREKCVLIHLQRTGLS